MPCLTNGSSPHMLSQPSLRQNNLGQSYHRHHQRLLLISCPRSITPSHRISTAVPTDFISAYQPFPNTKHHPHQSGSIKYFSHPPLVSAFFHSLIPFLTPSSPTSQSPLSTMPNQLLNTFTSLT